MANTADLSPIWRSLPYDLVQEIINHFTDDVIASCDYGDDHADGQMLDPGFPGRVYRYWQTFRQDRLFKSQRRRLERHFRDRWLTNMTLYLELDHPNFTTQALSCYCRYFPFSDIIVKDTNDILQGTFTEEQGEHRDSDSETVTFYLHGPVMAEEYIEPTVYLYEVDESVDDPPLPTLVSRAWEEIFDNHGEGDKAVWFGVGLCMPGDRFQLWRTSDIFCSWIVGLEAAGLEVFEEGRRIQFRWKRLMTDFLMHSASIKTIMEDETWAPRGL